MSRCPRSTGASGCASRPAPRTAPCSDCAARARRGWAASGRGDIHYRFVIDMPRKLNKEQRAAVDALSQGHERRPARAPVRGGGDAIGGQVRRDGDPRSRSRVVAPRIKLATNRGVFMISVAAELADMHPQTLRMYEARGLIEPKRSPKGTRLYSHEDVDRLRRIQEMTAELGLNLAGVERVLELEARLSACAAASRHSSARRSAPRCELAEELEKRAPLLPGRARALPPQHGDSCRPRRPAPPFASRRRAPATTAAAPAPDTGQTSTHQRIRELTMQADRFTIKSQEALQAAEPPGRGTPPPQVTPRTCSPCCSSRARTPASCCPCWPSSEPPRAPIRAAVNAALDQLPTLGRRQHLRAGAPASELQSVLRAAEKEAGALGDQYVSTEHLLLALSGDKGRARARRCAAPAPTRDELLAALAEVRGSHRVTDQSPEDKYQALERYGRDLTQAAEQGKLDPVIGRDDEIRRVIQVLSRRTKNNPVLIGEPGVGKTAIVEGLAQRIVSGRHPRVAARPSRDRAGHRRADRRLQVPRGVRGPSQGGAQGDRRGPGRGDPVHGRAAHDRGRRGGRGRRRRRQPAQADARARRAARGGRDHAGRVPQAHREGRRAGASLPAGDGGRALGAGHDRHPARV